MVRVDWPQGRIKSCRLTAMSHTPRGVLRLDLWKPQQRSLHVRFSLDLQNGKKIVDKNKGSRCREAQRSSKSAASKNILGADDFKHNLEQMMKSNDHQIKKQKHLQVTSEDADAQL